MKKPGQDTSVEQFFLPHLLLWWVFTPISQPSRITSVRLVRRFLQCWQIFHLLFKKNQKKPSKQKKKKFNSLHFPGTHGALIIPVQVHISSLMGNKRVKERGDENHSSLQGCRVGLVKGQTFSVMSPQKPLFWACCEQTHVYLNPC